MHACIELSAIHFHVKQVPENIHRLSIDMIVYFGQYRAPER